MVLDSGGNLYFTETSGQHLRVLHPDGNVSTVAGVTSDNGDDDFVDGLSAKFYNPRELELLPDDSVLIVDTSNYALRRYWP